MASAGTPYLIPVSGPAVPLARVAFEGQGVGPSFSEKDFQAVLHAQIEILPFGDVDAAYKTVVPLCRELRTPSGFVDLVGVTPDGHLVIIETKLWRNPQARREVVAQLLDYAKEFSRWTYSDLEREVKKVTGNDRRSLFERVAAVAPTTSESAFCDQVSRQLRYGQFMLLVVGDGIREGVSDLAAFLDDYGVMQFSFGLIEVAIHLMPDGARLFSATVVAKTAILERTVLIPRIIGEDVTGEILEEEEDGTDVADGPDPEKVRKAEGRLAFWTKLRNTLKFDDVRQPLPSLTRGYNIFLPVPPAGGGVRIAAYLGASKNEMGVYMNCKKPAIGVPVWDALRRDEDAIREELGFDVRIPPDRSLVIIIDKLGDMSDPANEERVLTFFREKLNRFVSVFRPRLEKIAAELQGQ